MFYKVVFSLLCTLLSMSVSAKYVTPLGGPGVEITTYFTHGNGAVTLYISGDVINSDNCEKTYRVHIPQDLPGKDNLISAALMAFASGQKIGLHASHCSTTAFWGGTEEVPIINNLWVIK